MGTLRLKLTASQKLEICLRARAGEPKRRLEKEYPCSARQIGRIMLLDPEMLRAEAGVKKDRVRVKAPTKRIPFDQDFQEWVADNHMPVDPPIVLKGKDPEVALAPLGTALPIEGLVRKAGGSTIAGDGSVIVYDSDGKPVKVEACPVYSPKWSTPNRRFHTRETVYITDINGMEIRAVAGPWYGEKIPGNLFLFGVGKVPSGVEFIPDKLADGYVKEHRELKARLG